MDDDFLKELAEQWQLQCEQEERERKDLAYRNVLTTIKGMMDDHANKKIDNC